MLKSNKPPFEVKRLNGFAFKVFNKAFALKLKGFENKAILSRKLNYLSYEIN